MLNNYPINQALIDYEVEQECRLREAQDYYSALGCCLHWSADLIYEKKIISIIGEHGMELLKEFNLIKFRAMIRGEKIYAL